MFRNVRDMSDGRIYVVCPECKSMFMLARRGMGWSFGDDEKFNAFMFEHSHCEIYFEMNIEDEYKPEDWTNVILFKRVRDVETIIKDARGWEDLLPEFVTSKD